ncbi:MAG: potassium channel family protein [Syntrophales bacterium]
MNVELGILAALLGAALIMVTLWEGFETIILPRRVTRELHLSRLFFLLCWQIWKATGRTLLVPRRIKETWLSLFGPLFILIMLFVWVSSLVFGFALLHWAVALLADIKMTTGAGESFLTFLYLSGTTFFTLGLGDVIPANDLSRFFTAVEAGMGFGFLALLISYLPGLNQSFIRREINIVLLDARAGSPPCAAEMLRRHSDAPGLEELRVQLKEWELWSAELLESHLTYPVLAYFRSQHDNGSWLGSLAAILDTCALLMVGLEGSCARQAKMTFAIARHTVVDLSLIFKRPPHRPTHDRLPPKTLAKLQNFLMAAGLEVNEGKAAEQKLAELRQMYEPYLNGLAAYFRINLPPWIAAEKTMDNWQVSAWERQGDIFLKADRTGGMKSDHW